MLGSSMLLYVAPACPIPCHVYYKCTCTCSCNIHDHVLKRRHNIYITCDVMLIFTIANSWSLHPCYCGRFFEPLVVVLQYMPNSAFSWPLMSAFDEFSSVSTSGPSRASFDTVFSSNTSMIKSRSIINAAGILHHFVFSPLKLVVQLCMSSVCCNINWCRAASCRWTGCGWQVAIGVRLATDACIRTA